MDRLYRTIVQLGRFKVRCDDDFADRLNYIYTVVILVLFSIIVSTRQYIGDPMICWVPAHFTGPHQKYANNICWIANTYWLPIEKEIPESIAERKETQISYYQWVPFVLVAQAVIFIIPSLVWRALSGKSGINVRSIVEVAVDIQNLNPDVRSKCVRYLSKHIESCLDNQREYRKGRLVRIRQTLSKFICIFCGRRYGNYLVVSYVIIKILFLANSIGQLWFLNVFVGHPYRAYGLEIVLHLARGINWESTGVFPRITMCDFQIRQLGNIHRHTVQCALPINMFNEKIFIFMWFWMILMICVNLFSLLGWLSRAFFRMQRLTYVRKYLKITGRYKRDDTKIFERFCEQYLRQDGVFVMRIIAKNAGDLIVSDIINAMWQSFVVRVKKVDTVSENPLQDLSGSRRPLIHDINGSRTPKDKGSEADSLRNVPIPNTQFPIPK